MAANSNSTIAVLEIFRALDAEVQALSVLIFLLVANANGPISMRDLQQRLGAVSSTTSRNVAALSKQHRLGKPGLDLLMAYEDPADRRYKLVRLTVKGKAIAAQIASLMS